MMFAGDSEYQKAFEKMYRKITVHHAMHMTAAGIPEYNADDMPGPADELSDPDALAQLYENSMDAGARKSSGTYYTPPEVVRFMCRDVLAHYLSNKLELSFDCVCDLMNRLYSDAAMSCQLYKDNDTIKAADKALEDIRVFDPATGCGAYVTGMLHEIVQLRTAMTRYICSGTERTAGTGSQRSSSGISEKPEQYEMQHIKRHPFELKLRAVTHSIYGTDIDPAAVEIVRLRLWHDLRTEFERYKNEAGVLEDMPGKERTTNCIAAACRQTSSSGNMAHMLEMPVYGSFKCNIICADSLLEYEACGFDAVIGNPPYISAVEAAKRGRDMRRTLKNKFPQLKGAFDIYAAFLLDGIRRTNENGVYCWIVPNKLLVSQYAAPVLGYLKKNGLRYSISVSDIRVFSGVGVYPVIITGNKKLMPGSKNQSPDSKKRAHGCKEQAPGGISPGGLSSDPPEQYREYSAGSLRQLAGRCFVIRPELKKYDTFANHDIRIASGAAGFQAAVLKQYIKQGTEHIKHRPDCTGDILVSDGTEIQSGIQSDRPWIPFAVSGSIDKYRIRHESIRYMGTTYRKPYITKGEKIADSKWNLWCSEKICIAGLTRELEAYYSKEPLALGVGVYAIYGFGGYDPLYLLGLINSKFMSWYVSEKYHERHLSGDYLAINKHMLEQLPLADAGRTLQAQIACRAEKLLEIFKNYGQNSSNTEAKQLMAEIDGLVYMLYQLDDKEIDRIKTNFE